MVRVEDLVKSFGGSPARSRRDRDGTANVRAVNGVSFDIAPGEMFTLLGPSGCGKTTTLRSIAGLEQPDSGRITVGGRLFFDGGHKVNVATHDRGLGMVFQSYAIWPHMTVFQNVAFPLEVKSRRWQRRNRTQIAGEVEQVLKLTGLDTFAGRPATKLSGGQQQRLALARALVVNPRLLLLDEPLSNLDAKLRETMGFELKRMQRELGVTSIYVTHDQSEALALSSRIAVMNEGQVIQVASPREIYERPVSRFVAEFIGTTNFLTGTVRDHLPEREQTMVTLDCGEQVVVPTDQVTVAGQQVTLSIRPESVALSTEQPAQARANVLAATVRTRGFKGDAVDHEVVIGETIVRTKSNPAQSYAPGTTVYATLPPEKVVLMRTAE